MNNKVAFLVIMLVGLLSYSLGLITGKQKDTEELQASMVAMSNIANDRLGEALLLSHLYEELIESPESAKQQIILALLLMYSDDIYLKDIFDNNHGTDNFAIRTNLAVLDFLKKHSHQTCLDKSGTDLVKCNLAALGIDV